MNTDQTEVTEVPTTGPTTDTLAPELPILALGAVLLLLGIAGFFAQRWYRHRAARSVSARLRRACDDMLTGIVLPDPDRGQIHLGFVLLTRHGVIVVDVRDAEGHVFGSEAMQEWTVLSRNRRYTFANPLPALHDRVAAVRRLVPDMPVQGFVAFTGGADFSKGQPPHVVLLENLIAELERRRAGSDDMGTRQLLEPLWQRLKQQVGAAGQRIPAVP